MHCPRPGRPGGGGPDHRGPDDQGTFFDGRVALGHNRLSILDLSSAGHQPMHSSSGRYIIAFNGEIYNHLNLRERLDIESDNSIKWVGHSDTETLLSCFEAWGIEATLKEVSGMFAIALYDTKHNSFYLIRDRMGEKPLYYGWINNDFVFGSELKSIKEFNGFSGEVDRNALALYLKYDYIPSPYSIYKGIRKLTQGSYFKISMGDDGWSQECTSSIKRYWSMEDIVKSGKGNNKFNGSDQDAIQKLDDLLSKSVKQQMISDVPLGAFLSGGIDSPVAAFNMFKRGSSNSFIHFHSFPIVDSSSRDKAIKLASSLSVNQNKTLLYLVPFAAIQMEIIAKVKKI